ncbi:MAG: YybH family protein [Micromonosporaceae bacterium]
MDRLDHVADWIDRYLTAWNSNDPADIGALFTDDAVYYTAPFDPPWQGRAQIIESWLADKDEPGETTFDWNPVSITDEVAIIEATTTYPNTTYSNLWVIRLDDEGRCGSFTEWWMEHPEPPDE